MKGIVFVYGSEIVLRFVSTGAFRMLEAEHQITYVVLRSSTPGKDGGVDASLLSGQNRVEWVPFYPDRFERWIELFDISCLRYRDRSTSFQVRCEEHFGHSPARTARLEPYARPETYEAHRRAAEADMGLHPDLLALTLRERPDFFVLPSALLDYFTDDVLQIADALRVPTLMLVAGWDNLSSKGLLHHQPTAMGVWGEQSRRHAQEVQGTPPGTVHLIGAPQYEDFRPDPTADRAAVRQSLGVPPDRPLALFAGTLRLFDETALLRELDLAIEEERIPAMHVLYRPHPWRVSRASEADFFAHEWRHITMDCEMAGAYRAAKGGDAVATPDNFLFRMHHLVQIYRAADLVVSPMSTILLEALLFGLPTMAVAFGDGKHSWSADKVSRMYHFKELYDVPGVVVCRDRSEFFPSLQKLLGHGGDPVFSRQLRESTGQFVYRDGRSYAERVAELARVMLAGVEGAPLYDTAVVHPGKTFQPTVLERARRKVRAAAARASRLVGRWRTS